MQSRPRQRTWRSFPRTLRTEAGAPVEERRRRRVRSLRSPSYRLSRNLQVVVGQPTAYLAQMDVTSLGVNEIMLTNSAAARVAAIAARQGRTPILRLSVDGGGCSGFQYRFGLAEGIDADDAVSDNGGVKLVVDAISLDLVRGCSVDYVEALGGSAFRVANPNAASGCGCGASFSV